MPGGVSNTVTGSIDRNDKDRLRLVGIPIGMRVPDEEGTVLHR
jgi:hypothetical protein